MDNKELITQITDLFKEQSQALSSQLKAVNERLDSLENGVLGTRLDIENNVSRRIDALFDGYKLTHDKQWEQEREIKAMQEKIQALEIQIQAINDRLA